MVGEQSQEKEKNKEKPPLPAHNFKNKLMLP